MTLAPRSPDPAGSSDIELVRDTQSGDLRAFERLMRRHNRALFRTARAILKDDAEAEDAVQEAYLRAYESMAGFRGDSRLSTWLIRIVANEAFARLRKRTRRAKIVQLHGDVASPSEAGAEAELEAPAMDRPDSAMLRSELRALIEARIDALPDAYRTVFVLRAVEERTVEETATCLDIPEATVRTRFFRARSLMREMLELDLDHACGDAFAFAGERCDRIVANVLAQLGRKPGGTA